MSVELVQCNLRDVAAKKLAARYLDASAFVVE
jgi:hypothetical protein